MRRIPKSSFPIAWLAAVATLVLTACAGGNGAGPGGSVGAPLAAEDAAAIEQASSIDEQTGPKRKVVVLDPGHGGDEIGASAFGVVEKDSNLDLALRVEALLQAADIDVVLTRRTDARAAAQVPGYTATRSDLQARLDIANRAGGDVFVSLHSNGSTDPSLTGIEAWYDSNRAFAAEGKTLADLLVRRVLEELRVAGFPARDRGLFDGVCFRQREDRCFTLFVIGGPRETTREEVLRRGGDPEALGFAGGDAIYSRPAEMPAALLELLMITNPADAAVLRTETARDAMARGVADAILEFLSLPAN